MSYLDIQFKNPNLDLDSLVAQLKSQKGLDTEEGTLEEKEAVRQVLEDMVDSALAKFLDMAETITVRFDFTKRTATVLPL